MVGKRVSSDEVATQSVGNGGRSRDRARQDHLMRRLGQLEASLESRNIALDKASEELTILRARLNELGAKLAARNSEYDSLARSNIALARDAESARALQRITDLVEALSLSSRNQPVQTPGEPRRSPPAESGARAARSSAAPSLPPLVGRVLGRGAARKALAHRAEAIKASGLFDAEWYTAKNRDVAETGADPAVHYISNGAGEGRNPHPLFDHEWYVSAVGGYAALNGLTALEHYLQSGPGAPSPCPAFDPAHYRAQGFAPETADLADYVTRGWRAGASPSPFFDPKIYTGASAASEPLANYLEHEDGYSGPLSKNFDAGWYLEHHTDVREAGTNPLLHFIVSGRAEGRRGTPANQFRGPGGRPMAAQPGAPRRRRSLPDLFDVRATPRESDTAVVVQWTHRGQASANAAWLARLAEAFDLFVIAPPHLADRVHEYTCQSRRRRLTVIEGVDAPHEAVLFGHMASQRVFSRYNLIGWVCISENAPSRGPALALTERFNADPDLGILAGRTAPLQQLQASGEPFKRFSILRARLGRPRIDLDLDGAAGETLWMRGLLMRDLAASLTRPEDLDVESPGPERGERIGGRDIVQALVSAAAHDGGFSVERIGE